MIELKHVSFSYEKDRPVLRDVSFTVREGESVGLIGANGAGKSTLLRLLPGLLTPGAGDVLIDGVPVEKKSLSVIRKKLGFVLQDSDDQLFMPTVYDDLCFGPMNYGLSRAETERRVDEVLARLGIEALKNRHNHRLSGGEKRMAAIASVLVMEPAALLMDEPTAALDPWNRRVVINTVRALPHTRLIASHDLDMILDCCERVLLLSGGAIAADGPADTLLRDRALLAAHRLEPPLSLSGIV